MALLRVLDLSLERDRDDVGTCFDRASATCDPLEDRGLDRKAFLLLPEED